MLSELLQNKSVTEEELKRLKELGYLPAGHVRAEYTNAPDMVTATAGEDPSKSRGW